jgi:hypothetical protein
VWWRLPATGNQCRLLPVALYRQNVAT